ncbi:MAG: hypothetical protein JXR70_12915 [Spirochaetales bacterium]|nr:hypothetical protein [Spirochaetales bacterium]
MKQQILCVILFLIMVTSLTALEVSDGQMKLVLYNNIGRFSVYYLSDAEKQSYTSFFLDSDVRTSLLTIVADSKVYRMGESVAFKEAIEKTSNGAKIVWISNSLEIVEDFSFISSNSSAITDGVHVTLSITNKSDSDMKIGARYLFDTVLGESSYVHFKTPFQDSMTNETFFTKSDMIDYWVSPSSNDPENVALQVVTKGSGITTPDKVIFANWKRLNETAWNYTESSSRNFTQMPYSVNDSAVCHYYDPVVVKSGSALNISFVIANYSSSGFSISSSGSTDSAIKDILAKADAGKLENTKLSSGSTTMILNLKSDITTISNLIIELNKKLADTENVTEADIESLKKIITELEDKLKKYKGK